MKIVCTNCPDPAFLTWILKSCRKQPKYIVFKILNEIGFCYILMRDKLYKYPACKPRARPVSPPYKPRGYAAIMHSIYCNRKRII